MGAQCSSENKARDQVSPDTEKLIANRGYTIRDLDNASFFKFYSPGTAVHQLTLNVCNENLSPDDMMKLKEINNNHKVNFYYNSCIVNACMADGVLDEKEEKYIYSIGKDWALSDDDWKEALKGKDYAKELSEAWPKVYKIFKPSYTDEQIKAITHGIKKHCILHCICACSQDGFVKEEYKQVQKLANSMDVTKEEVKELINIVRMERYIAKSIKDMLVQ